MKVDQEDELVLTTRSNKLGMLIEGGDDLLRDVSAGREPVVEADIEEEESGSSRGISSSSWISSMDKVLEHNGGMEFEEPRLLLLPSLSFSL